VGAFPSPAVARALDAWLHASGEYQDIMAAPSSFRPPWGSKERINRAGEALRRMTAARDSSELSEEDAKVLDTWRGSHRYILNTFQAILRNRTRGTGIVVAQRLKRRATIIDKLDREPRMQLARMDDVAGCRLIFPSLKEMQLFRGEFQWARFKHKRRNHLHKYDYIKNPKYLGYRGIHDVYEYRTTSVKGAPFKGLLLELQYRTRCQHAWATTVEIMTHLTGYEPKFNRGDLNHIEFLRLASEIIARTCDMPSCFASLKDIELAAAFEAVEAKLHLMPVLRRMQPQETSTAGGSEVFILQIGKDQGLQVHEYPNRGAAAPDYFKLEKEHPHDDIVLVTAESFEGMRDTFRNYFYDVREFVRLVDEGCKSLRSQADGQEATS
jgi:putative GTP pyrophosphokinase